MQEPYSAAPHAFSAAPYSSPATPALLPVASEEQDVAGTAMSMRVPKFVHPSSCRYEGGVFVTGTGPRLAGPSTAFTTIVCGSAPGWLWCSASSSAAEAITVTPWL